MTRNNLSEHLSWLLRNTAITQPVGPGLPTPRDTLDSAQTTAPGTSLDGQNTASQQRLSALSRSFLDPTRPPSQTSTTTDAARPPEDNESTRDVGMARLTSSTKSRKPGLVTAQNQSHQRQQPQLLTPASTSGVGRLGKLYQNSFAPDGSGSAIHQKKTSPSSNRQWNKPSSQGLTPEPVGGHDEDRLFDDDDVLDIEDLTGADQSSSSFEVFGNDVTLWREDYASRPEPPSKRGKKRKSIEITKTPSRSKRLEIQDEDEDDFPDIYELTSPARSVKRPATSSTPYLRAVASPPETSVIEHHTVTQTISTTATRIRTTNMLATAASRPPDGVASSGSRTASPKTLTPKAQPSARKTRSQLSPAGHLLGSGNRGSHSRSPSGINCKVTRGSEIIMDSEDEFLTPPMRKASFPTTGTTTDVDGPNGAALDTNDCMELDVEPVLAIETPSKIRCSPAKTGQQLSNRSPRNSGLSTMASQGDTDEPKRSGSILEDDSQNSETERNKNVLSLFLRNQSVVQRKRQFIEEQLQQNRREFDTALRANWPKERREKVKKDRDPLLKQQRALDNVMSEFASRQALAEEKETLVTAMSEAYDRGLDLDADELKLDELNASIQDKEKALLRSLIKAGVEDLDFLKDADDSMTMPDVPAPVVLSTQAPQPPLKSDAPTFSRQSTIIPEYNSQVITQTQVQQAEQTSWRSNRNGQLTHQRPVSPEPFPRGSISSAARRERPGHEYPSFEADPFLQEAEESIFVDDEPPSFVQSRPQMNMVANRKSPFQGSGPSAQHDNFSDFSDDEDLLAAADSFEQSRSSIELSGSARRTRHALAETSNNALVVPKQRAASKKVPSSLPKAKIPPELMRHKWSEDVRRALKDRFRMTGFRHNQLEAINATLAGRDAFVLMPTGGGKSLCYQLPAVVNTGATTGVTIVISPLLSLMQDQVDHLQALNIIAKQINGSMEKGERSQIMSLLRERTPENYIQLLYVTPEMVKNSENFIDALTELHKRRKLARIVIDEAHCVSQWGHDFRPDYKELGEFRRKFPGVPVIALTATATENVILDVKHNLGMKNCQVFSQSFNRPNLYYEVRKKGTGVVDSIAELINEKYAGMTGIIYTLSRKKTEQIAEKLRAHRIQAHHYHADMKPDKKAEIQKEWQKGRIKVVVATIAFGMGIDKPDVRFVIHEHLPKSLEGYYQETGRAGRDGKPSDCYLYFMYGDLVTLKRMIQENESGSKQQKDRQIDMLQRVVAFAEDQHTCRRVEILRYFGEKFDKALCDGGCDNCASGRDESDFQLQDFTRYAVAALEVIQECKRLTLGQCVDALQGRQKKEFGHLEQFGMAKGLKQHEVQRVIHALATQGALSEANKVIKKYGFAVTRYVLGRAADAFLSGQRKLEIVVRLNEETAPAPKKRAPKKKAADASKLPPSTNISSPLKAPARKRKAKVPVLDAEDEESEPGPSGPLHANGYEDDGFVVGDDDLSDDGFEPVRSSKAPPRRRQQTLDELGPAISRDARLAEANLTEIHEDIIPVFVDAAKTLEEQLRNKSGLRRNLFTEQQYREMVIRWTTTVAKMRRIPGIDVEKVDTYGQKFVPLVKLYHSQYQEMMGEVPRPAVGKSGRTVSGNHECIDLVSSDDEEEEGDEHGPAEQMADEAQEDSYGGLDWDDDDEEALEVSRYFDSGPAQPASRGAAASSFPPRGTAAGRGKARGQPSGGGSSSWRGGGKKSFAGGRKASAGSRGGYGGRRASGGGVSKRGKASAAGKGKAAVTGGKKATHAGFGSGGGIPMMPI